MKHTLARVAATHEVMVWDTAKWLAMLAKQWRWPCLTWPAQGGCGVIWGHFYPTGITWGCQPGHKSWAPYPTARGQRSSQHSYKGLPWLFFPQSHCLCSFAVILSCSFPANCHSPWFSSSSWVVSVATLLHLTLRWVGDCWCSGNPIATSLATV